MTGFDLELVGEIAEASDVPVIAAGGCGSKEDFSKVVEVGASAVAAGSIFYWIGESIISIKEYMHTNGIYVRII